MSSDAVMNVSFKNLVNKRKIWLDNRGGSFDAESKPFGPAIGDNGGRNESFIWEGHITDPNHTSDRSLRQWVVLRRWILDSKVKTVNAGNNAYDDTLISWETAGGAYVETNPPSYFRLHFSPAIAGKVISTATAEVFPGVAPLQDAGDNGGHPTRCIGIAPYCAYGSCDIWVGATVPTAGAGDSAVPEGQFNTAIGGKVMDTWEEGIMCPNFFTRPWRFEVRGAKGEQLGIVCRNLNNQERRSHFVYGANNLPGVLVSWMAEFDVYDILPEAEERLNPNGALPDRKNIPRY